MSKVVFCDLNRELVLKIKELGIPVHWGDYFAHVRTIDKPVLMTASNPAFTFGGGIDAKFYENYKGWCDDKQERPGYNERIENICFVITVDNHLKASREKVKEAIQFSLDSLKEGETLLIHGAGCGIGANPQFTKDDFVVLLKELVL